MLLTISLGFLPGRAAAQVAATSATTSKGSVAADTGKFLSGAALALGMHEGGHVVLEGLFDAAPGVKRITFGPFPFFAITHHQISPRRELAVSSAGFWVQDASNEWLLTRRRDLRRAHAPLEKGMLVFNVLMSVGYGAVAMAEAGPLERDTRGIAASARVREPVIGLLVMAPGILDGYRFLEPDARWAVWVSRALKVGSVFLIAR